MASTPTERSKPKPASELDGFVRLLPPKDSGFSGTALMHAVEQKDLIEGLIARGYTKVDL